ncbi:MAG: protein kinase [Candidatus Aminicenantes bacterium]|nr:protein kinase [Candidatus Aminicenantes bacterium]
MSVRCPKCQHENPDDTLFCGKCGTRFSSPEKVEVTKTIETPKEELATGSTFAGRYQIIEELGKGGMGNVYKVLDKETNERIALKLIKPEIASDKKTIERFRNELTTARKIVQKNVCRMYDLNKDKNRYYITMEYVSGGDLKKLIRRAKRLDAGTAISIVKQICEGLEEAHGLGIVHRDLKPNNIMIDDNGNARIMDFGIARSVKEKGITGSGILIGTPEYMSPEQVEAKDIDQRSDIYSLGIIFYEMVTGRLPFDGDTPLAVALMQKDKTPKDPKKLNPQIPVDLCDVILRCLEKKREKRYQSAKELYAELNNIEKGFPENEREISKRKPIISKEITVAFEIKKLFLPALIVFSIIAVTVLIWQLLLKKPIIPISSGEPSLAVMYFENRSNEQDLDKIIVDMLTTNLSRNKEVKVISSQRLFDILKQIGKEDSEKVDKSMATEVAYRAGVKTMMMGSIIKMGNKIRIISQLIDVQSGAIIGSQQAEGSEIRDVFEMVDQLTEKVSTVLGILPEEQDKRLKIADVTTNSFEAYRHYQKGMEAVWKWNFDEAMKRFEQAVALDSTFALAHLYWAVAKSRYGLSIRDPFTDFTPIQKSIDLAKKYASKATDKERRMIDIYDAFFNRKFETAYRLAEDLNKHYPDDKDSNFLLGDTAWYANRYELSIKALERTLEIDPTFSEAYLVQAYWNSRINNHQKAISAIKKHIALLPKESNAYDSAWEIYMRAGLFDDALKACEDALRINPNWLKFYTHQAYAYLFKGEKQKAYEKIHQLRAFNPTEMTVQSGWLSNLETSYMGYIYLYGGRYRDAYAEFQRVLKLARDNNNVALEMCTHLDLGKMNAELRQYSKAVEEFMKGEKLSLQIYSSTFNPIQIITNYLVGIVMVKKEDYASAQACADKIIGIIKSNDYNDFYLDFSNLLNAEVFVSQRNGQAAVNKIRQLSSVTSFFSPRCRILNAAGYMLIGELEKAIDAYTKFNNAIDTRTYGMGDNFYFFLEQPKLVYYIAQICELKGDTAGAVEHYEKFLTLWKDADPGLPELDDAKQRLADLR